MPLAARPHPPLREEARAAIIDASGSDEPAGPDFCRPLLALTPTELRAVLQPKESISTALSVPLFHLLAAKLSASKMSCLQESLPPGELLLACQLVWMGETPIAVAVRTATARVHQASKGVGSARQKNEKIKSIVGSTCNVILTLLALGGACSLQVSCRACAVCAFPREGIVRRARRHNRSVCSCSLSLSCCRFCNPPALGSVGCRSRPCVLRLSRRRNINGRVCSAAFGDVEAVLACKATFAPLTCTTHPAYIAECDPLNSCCAANCPNLRKQLCGVRSKRRLIL